jgi:hypothetical protein
MTALRQQRPFHNRPLRESASCMGEGTSHYCLMRDMTLRQLLPIPTVSFSDDGWAQIANRSGLPVEARSDVERAASIYKMSDIGSSLDQTRKEIADTEKALRSGRSGLEKLTANQRAIAVLSEARGSTSCSEAKTPLAKARTDLAEAIETIDDIVNYISSGRLAIKRSKPGAREASLRVKIFIKLLDDILFAFTEKHVSRSSSRELITAAKDSTSV